MYCTFSMVMLISKIYFDIFWLSGEGQRVVGWCKDGEGVVVIVASRYGTRGVYPIIYIQDKTSTVEISTILVESKNTRTNLVNVEDRD